MRSRGSVLTLLLFILLVIYVFLYFYSFDLNQSKSFSLIVLLLNLFALVIFSIDREPISAMRKQYIRIIPIFILGYIIVFFQLHLDYVIGNFDESVTRYWVNSFIVPKALMISSIGFLAFLLGYMYRRNRRKRILKGVKRNGYKYLTSVKGYSWVSLFFLITMFITINPLYLYGGYGAFEMGDVSRYSSILFELSFTAGLIQHIVNTSLLKETKITFYKFINTLGFFHLLLFTIYSIAVLMSGDRGPVIYLGTGLIGSYALLTKWKMSKVKILGSFIIASVIVSGLVIIRNQEDKTSFIDQLYDSITSSEFKGIKSLDGANSVSKSTLELATSIRTLHNAVDAVPKRDPYFYGQLQLVQVMTIIPLGSKLIKNILDLSDSKLTSANYVTKLVGGENGSEGTSCVADLYLDFGVAGVFFGMLFFGTFVRRLEEETFGHGLPKLFILTSYVIICQYAIYISRASLVFSLRNIIWILVIMKLVKIFSKKTIIK